MTVHLNTDIVIAGAGPAGCILARELAPRFRVLLVEPRALDASVPFPDKVCGGLLSPGAQRCLFHLGLPLPAHVLVSPQAFGVMAIDLEARILKMFQRNYINMARDRFDRWLFQVACAQNNVQILLERRLAHFAEHSTGVMVTLDDGTTIEAQYLMGADGGHSRVRQLLGDFTFTSSPPEPHQAESGIGLVKRLLQPKRNLAVQYWFTPKEMPSKYGAYFHSAVTREYAWSIPKEKHLLVGTTMPWPGGEQRAALVEKRMNTLLEALSQYGYFLGDPVRKESCALLNPGLSRSIPLGRGRVFLLGEAAGIISPSSAEGIGHAIRSAMSLALALQGPEGATDPDICRVRYEKGIKRLIHQLSIRSLKGLVVYHPRLRRPVLRSGVGSTSPTDIW